MKLLESVKELLEWTRYHTYTKESLKLVKGEVPAFISKDKLEFQVDGKPWKGHAFIAGEKAIQSVNKFKKDGVIFRPGRCTRKAKELYISGFEKTPKLVKETEKTFLKLKLGYKIITVGAEAGGAAAPGAENAWKKIKAKLSPGIKKAVDGNSPNKAKIVGLLRQATSSEKSGDFAGAAALFEEMQGLLDAGGSTLTPERRKEIVTDLSEMEKNIDKLMAALKR